MHDVDQLEHQERRSHAYQLLLFAGIFLVGQLAELLSSSASVLQSWCRAASAAALIACTAILLRRMRSFKSDSTQAASARTAWREHRARALVAGYWVMIGGVAALQGAITLGAPLTLATAARLLLSLGISVPLLVFARLELT